MINTMIYTFRYRKTCYFDIFLLFYYSFIFYFMDKFCDTNDETLKIKS